MDLSDTSREAFSRVDRTAGQRRVLAWFHANPGRCFTRQDVADGANLLLQAVCGRVRELLDAGDLVELDETRDGRHLLKINATARRSIAEPTANPLQEESGHGDAAPVAPFDTSGEEYRHLCEVMWFCRLPTKERRKDYLAGVRKRRGDAAADRIKRDMQTIGRVL